MKIDEYYEEMMGEIRASSSAYGTSDVESFTGYVSNIFIDADLSDDPIEYLPFEGKYKTRAVGLSGFIFNELDGRLDLYLVVPLSYDGVQTFIASEAKRYFSRVKAFIEGAQYIKDNAEPSAPAYGLALELLPDGKYGPGKTNVKKYGIHLLTNLEMSKTIGGFSDDIVNGLPVEYHIWDIQRLYQMENSKTGKEDLIIDMHDYVQDGLNCILASQTADYTAYLCSIPGRVLATLYNKYGGRLLEGNVRSFLQTKGKVNKGIRNTILNEPAMFFAYNNGIAVTADDIKMQSIGGKNYITELTNMRIVNGGQTTASLATALLNDKKDHAEENISKINVSMKLSVVTPEKAQTLIPAISRYANSQNKVSEADLWSNHPYHMRMEDLSRRIWAPAVNGQQQGTHWYYERANGQYRQETYKATKSQKKKFESDNPKTQKFNKTDLARYINIWEMKPHIACKGGQKSFAAFAPAISTQWEKNPDQFNEMYYQRVVALAILYKTADRIVHHQTWYDGYKINIVAYTLSRIFYEVKKNYPGREINLMSIWKTQKLSQSWENQIAELSEVIFRFITDPNRGNGNVGEWTKSEACWKQAMDLPFAFLPAFGENLVDSNAVNKAKNDAAKVQKIDNKINAQIDVLNYGIDNWKVLETWSRAHPVLSPTDISFIRTALGMERGKYPSERQCVRILGVLEKARGEGFPG